MSEANALNQHEAPASRQPIGGLDLLFFVPYVIWLSYCLFSRSFFAQTMNEIPYLTIDNIFRVVAGLLLVRELCQAHRVADSLQMTPKSMVFAVLAAFVCGYGLLDRNSQKLLLDLFLIVAARNVDKDRLISCSFFCLSTCLVIIICSSLLNVIPNFMLIQSTRVRYCLGFRYCLVPSNILFAITCLWCLVKEERMRVIEAGAFLVMNAIMYVLTDSRLVFFASVAVIAWFLLHRRLEAFARRFEALARVGKALLANSTYVCIAITIVVTATYGLALIGSPDFASHFGAMFGKRVMRGYEGLMTMGVRLSGQAVTWVGHGLAADGTSSVALGNTYNYVDNIYLHVLIEQGLLYAAFHFVTLNLLSRRAVARRAMGLAVVLAAVAFCGLLDDHAIASYYNPFILLVLNGL
ncbi:MAG: hypothetical protein IKG18_09705 [Atopobiaceae bacterium]|nr:hypothetical protein [Atopobiaceae bacterium]